MLTICKIILDPFWDINMYLFFMLITVTIEVRGAWLASSYCMGFQNFVVSNKIHPLKKNWKSLNIVKIKLHRSVLRIFIPAFPAWPCQVRPPSWSCHTLHCTAHWTRYRFPLVLVAAVLSRAPLDYSGSPTLYLSIWYFSVSTYFSKFILFIKRLYSYVLIFFDCPWYWNSILKFFYFMITATQQFTKYSKNHKFPSTTVSYLEWRERQ